MDTDKEIHGNIGEWSELYAFAYILTKGHLISADRYLNGLEEELYLPVLRIIRPSPSGLTTDYCPGRTEGTVEIRIGDKLVESVPKSEFESAVAAIYKKLTAGGKEGVVKIPEVQEFLKKIHCTKLKADTQHKEDIRIQILDTNTGQTPIQGFSIKSYIGGNPTLLNASGATNFRYRLEGCNDQIMDAVNSIETRYKIKERMAYLKSSGCTFVFDGISSEIFQKNLRIVDTMLPEIVAKMLYYHYSTDINRVEEVVNMMQDEDPFDVGIVDFYTYKVKTLLLSIALGMVPNKPWAGREDANGGYVVVKENGEVVCFFLYGRNEFEDYLLGCTKFERPSTSRHKYMEVYKEGEEYYLNLNLQIRFCMPESRRNRKFHAVNLDQFTD